jgi:hypothetical protein
VPLNQSHLVIGIGDEAVQGLIEEVRSQMSILFKICESIAMLDMVISKTLILKRSLLMSGRFLPLLSWSRVKITVRS